MDIVSRIQNKKSINDVDLVALRRYLDAIEVLLKGVNATAAAELDLLQQDIGSLVEWANTSGQPLNHTLEPDRDLLVTITGSAVGFKILWRALPE